MTGQSSDALPKSERRSLAAIRSHRVQMSRMRRHHRRTPSPSQHWVLRPRWHGGQLVQRVDDTLPLRTLSTLCIQHTRAAMGKATSCPQHSSASASFTSQWPYSATPQAGGKPRQSNATGGKNAPLHKINWCSGINRAQEPEVLLPRQPSERSSEFAQKMSGHGWVMPPRISSVLVARSCRGHPRRPISRRVPRRLDRTARTRGSRCTAWRLQPVRVRVRTTTVH
jgi:hypothetical protein